MISILQITKICLPYHSEARKCCMDNLILLIEYEKIKGKLRFGEYIISDSQFSQQNEN